MIIDRKGYIKNKGVTKLVIKDNSKKDEKTLKWNVDYDGNEADVELDIKDNKNRKHYNWKLDNDDLAKILNIPSIEKPIHQRLKDDFLTQDANMIDDESLLMPLTLPQSMSYESPLLSSDFDMSSPSDKKMKVIVLNPRKRLSGDFTVLKISPTTTSRKRRKHKKRTTHRKKTTSTRRSSSRRSSRRSSSRRRS